eukprot:6021905-Alexandrium_andersonii.AAC.1
MPRSGTMDLRTPWETPWARVHAAWQVRQQSHLTHPECAWAAPMDTDQARHPMQTPGLLC